MHRDGNARGEEEERGAQKKHETARDRGHQIREGTRAAEHLSLSLSLSLCAIARGLGSAAGSRSGSGVGAADRASIVLPRGRGGTTAALFVRACASVTQSIDSLVACREGARGRGTRGGWVGGGGPGKRGSRRRRRSFPSKHKHGLACMRDATPWYAFDMHVGCPPRGKRLLHRAINARLHFTVHSLPLSLSPSSRSLPKFDRIGDLLRSADERSRLSAGGSHARSRNPAT